MYHHLHHQQRDYIMLFFSFLLSHSLKKEVNEWTKRGKDYETERERLTQIESCWGAINPHTKHSLSKNGPDLHYHSSRLLFAYFHVCSKLLGLARLVIMQWISTKNTREREETKESVRSCKRLRKSGRPKWAPAELFTTLLLLFFSIMNHNNKKPSRQWTERDSYIYANKVAFDWLTLPHCPFRLPGGGGE